MFANIENIFNSSQVPRNSIGRQLPASGPSWCLPFQHLLAPAPHTHHVESFTVEDDLAHRLPARAFAFQAGAHVHPADFAIRRADEQHDGVSLLMPVIGPARRCFNIAEQDYFSSLCAEAANTVYCHDTVIAARIRTGCN